MLRAVTLSALMLLIWHAVNPAELPPAVVAARGGLDRALLDATRRPVATLALTLDSTPGAVQRDWLGAVRAVGTAVAWSGQGLRPVGIAASPVAEPEQRIRVAVAGADGSTVVLSDQLGFIDTLRVQGAGASKLLRTASGSLVATAGGSRAVATRPTHLQVRRVLVIASAGWESKFLIVALEEAGWLVDARIRVAPGVETRQGGDFPLDTARYSAVIALDGAAASHATAIERYVSSGGGAILAGAAARLPAFVRITAGVGGSRRTGDPRDGIVLTGLKADAVILESQGAAPLVAARRSGSGRVVSSGYDESWQWRMRRAAEAPAGHRAWWTALVSAVAYVPASTGDIGGASDPAPLAALTAVLGPPSETARNVAGGSSRIPPAWLIFGVLLASLLGEVASRRYRGLA